MSQYTAAGTVGLYGKGREGKGKEVREGKGKERREELGAISAPHHIQPKAWTPRRRPETSRGELATTEESLPNQFQDGSVWDKDWERTGGG